MYLGSYITLYANANPKWIAYLNKENRTVKL